MDDNVQSSPLQDLLLNLEITNYVCISMILSLIIQIIFKFHVISNVKLHFSSILGANINNKLEYYLNKIIFLNKGVLFIFD